VFSVRYVRDSGAQADIAGGPGRAGGKFNNMEFEKSKR